MEQKYDSNGYDKEGYNIDGYDKDGFNKKGFNIEGINRQKLTEKDVQEKRKLELKEIARTVASGELSIEKFLKKSEISLNQLEKFAKNENLGSEIIKGINDKKDEYKRLSQLEPFKREELGKIGIIKDGQPVYATDEDIDRCIEYLDANDRLIKQPIVKSTLFAYLKGEIDFSEISEIQDNKKGQDYGEKIKKRIAYNVTSDIISGNILISELGEISELKEFGLDSIDDIIDIERKNKAVGATILLNQIKQEEENHVKLGSIEEIKEAIKIAEKDIKRMKVYCVMNDYYGHADYSKIEQLSDAEIDSYYENIDHVEDLRDSLYSVNISNKEKKKINDKFFLTDYKHKSERKADKSVRKGNRLLEKKIRHLRRLERDLEEMKLSQFEKDNVSIEEVKDVVSDRKLSDINKASGEIVQANEENEQGNSSKEEHGEE